MDLIKAAHSNMTCNKNIGTIAFSNMNCNKHMNNCIFEHDLQKTSEQYQFYHELQNTSENTSFSNINCKHKPDEK